MSDYGAELFWQRSGEAFIDRRYSRRHLIRFDGGLEIPASSSPQVVPLPLSDPDAVDPEEAFVASLASCHLLWFLDIACRRRFCVESYADHPRGEMGRNGAGKLAMTRVTLHPAVSFAGENQPSRDEVIEMHRAAHEECFIASSVTSEVRCEPVFAPLPGASSAP